MMGTMVAVLQQGSATAKDNLVKSLVMRIVSHLIWRNRSHILKAFCKLQIENQFEHHFLTHFPSNRKDPGPVLSPP